MQAAANGNQLVAAEELLNLTQLQQHIQDTYSIKFKSDRVMSYLLLRASGRKRNQPKRSRAGQKN